MTRNQIIAHIKKCLRIAHPCPTTKARRAELAKQAAERDIAAPPVFPTKELLVRRKQLIREELRESVSGCLIRE